MTKRLRMAGWMPLIFALLLTPGVLAQHDHGGHGGHAVPSFPAQQVRTGKESGRVIGHDENSVTISMSKKGKNVEKTFFLTKETRRKGVADLGSDVEVKFREENGRLLATSVVAK